MKPLTVVLGLLAIQCGSVMMLSEFLHRRSQQTERKLSHEKETIDQKGRS
jgi:hypothetical protein